MCQILGIQKLHDILSPQSDGLVERANRTLINMIAKHLNASNDWVSLLPALSFPYNTSAHGVTKVSPYNIMSNRMPYLPIDSEVQLEHILMSKWNESRLKHALKIVQENSLKVERAQKTYYDRNSNVMSLKIILKECYKMIEENSPKDRVVEYPLIKLEINGKNKWIHANRCKLFTLRKGVTTNDTPVSTTKVPSRCSIGDEYYSSEDEGRDEQPQPILKPRQYICRSGRLVV
ncbi:Pol polyprotein [Thelohanellus kitauei]|uniref:Pol polyprotein n=1 Tax=Thelohanellus kitauei TaxID=669202 RepID=A0A0C2MKL8_THEKT|nr:Pol polyprotein [Thelohanellus kitauei]